MRTLISLIFFVLIVLPSLLFADDTAEVKDRLQKAVVNTALDSPDMKPWRLEMSFEIVDTRGRPTQTGTIEQWWVSPSMSKVIYLTGQSKWIEIVNQEGVFRSKGEPEPSELAKLLRRESVHPFPPGINIDNGTISLEQKQIGGVPLDCIRYSRVPDPKAKPVPSAGDPIYCLDRGKLSLRITSVHNTESFARIVVGTYAGKSVAIDQSISFNGVLAAKAHLSKLQSEQLAESDFVPEPEMTKVADAPVEVPAESAAGKWIKKVPPTYPSSAKQDHVSGTVLLHAIIGSDGRVLSLKPIYSPRTDLTDASIAAVRQWIYEPYLVNGTAHSVDTEITVNFAFGP